MAVPTNKNLAAEIVPHISSALRDLCVIFDKYILYRRTILAGEDFSYIVKRTEWRKFIDYFGLSIEADPSTVGIKNVDFSILGLYQAIHM